MAQSVNTNTTNITGLLPGLHGTRVDCPNCQEPISVACAENSFRREVVIHLGCVCGFNKTSYISEGILPSHDGVYYIVKNVLDEMLHMGSDLLTEAERELERELEAEAKNEDLAKAMESAYAEISKPIKKKDLTEALESAYAEISKPIKYDPITVADFHHTLRNIYNKPLYSYSHLDHPWMKEKKDHKYRDDPSVMKKYRSYRAKRV